jgi:hypothetical protein
MNGRIEHLAGQSLAKRQAIFARDLLDTLRDATSK